MHVHTQHTTPQPIGLGKLFLLAILLNLIYVIGEFFAGFYYNSVGLISDAAHNLGDVASLLLAWLAFRLSKVNATHNYTYGYKKSTILVALTNAIILMFTVGIIFVKSIEKIQNPTPVEGGVIAWVAGVGVIINLATALLFIKKKDKDLNVKGAYLHMMADALVSVGVVVSGIVILYTNWVIIDALIGIAIALVILFSTWGLLKSSLRLSLDGVPSQIDKNEIEQLISSHHLVDEFHHLHIWAISTTENALTVHIVVKDARYYDIAKKELKQLLLSKGVSHATIETETYSEACIETC